MDIVLYGVMGHLCYHACRVILNNRKGKISPVEYASPAQRRNRGRKEIHRHDGCMRCCFIFYSGRATQRIVPGPGQVSGRPTQRIVPGLRQVAYEPFKYPCLHMHNTQRVFLFVHMENKSLVQTVLRKCILNWSIYIMQT